MLSNSFIHFYNTHFRWIVMLRLTPANFHTACIVNEFNTTIVVNGKMNDKTVS